MRAWLFVMCLVCTSRFVVADQLSVAPEAFWAMSESDRLQILREALLKRAELLANAHYKARVENYMASYTPWQVGDRQQTIDHYDQEFWKRGDSYRFRHAGYKADDTKPLFISDSEYDAKRGVARMLGDHSQVKSLQGRINTKHDNITKFNEYANFLPGYLHGTKPSYLQSLMDNLATFELLDSSGESEVAIQYSQKLPSGRDLRQKFWIALDRDFMLVRWESRKTWNSGLADRHQSSDMWVVDAKQIDRLWMPQEVIRASWLFNSKAGVAGITHVMLDEMQIGNVKEKDLAVTFPKGTEVIDEIEQNAYVVSDINRPIPFLAQAPEVVESSKLTWGLIVNIAVIAVLAAIIAVRRFGRQKQRLT